MTYEVQDKVVIITGAATGIGELVVRYLVRDGAKYVAVLDVDENAGISLENELNSKYGDGRVKFFRCDVSNEGQLLEGFKSVTKKNGKIDIVINNAGIMNDSMEIYKKAIEVNLTALVTNTLKAMEIMRKDFGGNGGTIINISSVAALCQDHLLPVYFGTKSAVLQFSNCIGMPEYYTRTGVRVITICFGATNTALLTTTKLGSFDKFCEARLTESLKAYPRQRPESAAEGVIEVYKQGESGSTWLVARDEPAKDITSSVKSAYEILSAHVFDLDSPFN